MTDEFLKFNAKEGELYFRLVDDQLTTFTYEKGNFINTRGEVWNVGKQAVVFYVNPFDAVMKVYG